MTDEEIERIHQEAEEAAERAMSFGQARNPYPVGSDAHDIWAHAYRNHYARENGR
jgi:hypothetical protein